MSFEGPRSWLLLGLELAGKAFLGFATRLTDLVLVASEVWRQGHFAFSAIIEPFEPMRLMRSRRKACPSAKSELYFSLKATSVG